jgi:putative ABC transport system permease protein
MIGPPLAALPAIRRASRLPVHEALQATGSAMGGQGRLDALLRHVSFLPRSTQIGLRGVARRKRRTVATAMQVALAVGTLLGLLALGTSVANVTRSFWGDAHYDIAAGTVATRPFNAEATRVLASTAGVKQIEPLLTSTARIGGKNVALWGTTASPLMSMRMGHGRWFTGTEATRQDRVAVIGRQLAENLGAHVGETRRLETPTGPIRVRIIGISNSQNNEGLAVYLPLSTLQAVLHGIAEDYVRQTGAMRLADASARWRRAPMNDAQAALLRRLGITPPEGASKARRLT